MLTFNRFGHNGLDYQAEEDYHPVNYSKGWNPGLHDMLLQSNLDKIYMQYDQRISGQIQEQNLYYVYKYLCLSMGLCPPFNYTQLRICVEQAGYPVKGKIKKMDMYNLFKVIQGIKKGFMNKVNWGEDKQKDNRTGGMGDINFGTFLASMGLGQGFKG